MKVKMNPAVKTAALVLAALVFIFPVTQWLASPNTYGTTFRSIDTKAETVLALTAASTVASTAISAIPDDFGTPIANQIAEYTDYLLIIFSILLAEKYLLTVIALFTFRVFVPAALVSFSPFVWRKYPIFSQIALKIATVGLALWIVIPASMFVSDLVYDTYQISFDQTIASVNLLEEAPEAGQEDENVFSSMWGKVTDTVTSITDTITHIPAKVTAIVNNFIQSIAVMVVTTCIIPTLVMIFALSVVKIVFGANIPMPRPKHRKHLPEEKKELAVIEE